MTGTACPSARWMPSSACRSKGGQTRLPWRLRQENQVGVLCATMAGSNANANPVHVSAMQEVHISRGEPLEVLTARVGYSLLRV